MNDNCKYCGSTRTVPVIYERMDKANYLVGNKYRVRCEACDRWNPCCSREDWATADRPMVLPMGVDPKEPRLVPAGETEYSQRVKNAFTCPNADCDAEHVGFPNECDNCGKSYAWPT